MAHYHILTWDTGPPVYSNTGATLDPLQCMHSVHRSVCPVYTLTDTGIGSGGNPFLGILIGGSDFY